MLGLILLPALFAQDDEIHLEAPHPPDSTAKLGKDLRFGEFHFHFRSFYMQTNNRGPLLDYYTMAAGAGLGYKSPKWKGFQLGFSGFFVFQLFEHNLDKADPITGGGNRYEILLYDMNDLENTSDLDRLEDLYLSYSFKNLSITVGRQKINTPFLNEQDNRMRGNIFQGITANWKPKIKNTNFDLLGGFFTHATLRGTVDWYGMGESVGVYPFGRNPQGEPSQYKGATHTAGLAFAGLKSDFSGASGKWKTEVWNYFAENMFNLTSAQVDWQSTQKKRDNHLFAGAQGFFQTVAGNGGNPDPMKAFIQPGEYTYAIGGRLGLRKKHHLISFNYLGIANTGRFLFPREWGREHFYASLARERFEGNGGLHAYTLKYHFYPGIKGLDFGLGLSKVDVQTLSNYSLNKYGIPSYYHGALSIDYGFTGYLEGLHIKGLVVHKAAQNPAFVPDNFRLNRVDLWNLNLVIDFYF
jgi:hypothetical protein